MEDYKLEILREEIINKINTAFYSGLGATSLKISEAKNAI